MPRPRARFQIALPLTLVATLAVSLLPAGWRLPWEGDLAGIVHVFLMPFSHAGNALGGWLRPAPSAADGIPRDQGDLQQVLEDIIEDRDRARAESHRLRQKLAELEEQFRQLQQIPPETRERAGGSVIAYIAARNPFSRLGVVQLKLPSGEVSGIGPNTIAVYAGVHLLGRIVDQPTRSTCSLLPIVNPAAEAIRARVVPRDEPLAAGTLTLIEQTGSGTLAGEVDREAIAGEGDVVRLDDRRWPATAQGMVLGKVASVRANDEEPLRETITIRPVYQVQQVASVTLIIERPDDDNPEAASPGAAPGAMPGAAEEAGP
jgi:cell shape-determining protein MreC